MARTESTTVGSQVRHFQEGKSTGLLVQDGLSPRSSPTFNADNDQQFGNLEVWRVKTKATADQAEDAAAAITNVFGSTKVSRENKYRIIGVRTTVRDKRTGGSPTHEVKVETGDGAASESFASLVAKVSVASDTVNLPTERILVPAETLLLSGETLRVQLIVGGTTTTGTADVDVDILAMPVKA